MKKFLALLVVVIFFACGEEGVQEPERLLSEDEMVNILYDLSLLQTISSTNPKQIQENNVDVNKYIYNKYNIDSITFVQNQKYYASDIQKYQVLHTKVLKRLNEEKAPLDSLPQKKVTPAGRKTLRSAGAAPVRE